MLHITKGRIGGGPFPAEWFTPLIRNVLEALEVRTITVEQDRVALYLNPDMIGAGLSVDTPEDLLAELEREFPVDPGGHPDWVEQLRAALHEHADAWTVTIDLLDRGVMVSEVLHSILLQHPGVDASPDIPSGVYGAYMDIPWERLDTGRNVVEPVTERLRPDGTRQFIGHEQVARFEGVARALRAAYEDGDDPHRVEWEDLDRAYELAVDSLKGLQCDVGTLKARYRRAAIDADTGRADGVLRIYGANAPVYLDDHGAWIQGWQYAKVARDDANHAVLPDRLAHACGLPKPGRERESSVQLAEACAFIPGVSDADVVEGWVAISRFIESGSVDTTPAKVLDESDEDEDEDEDEESDLVC